mgnify:CR=1 FL=1
MVIGLVPVNTASAAATPGLKYSSKILYVDGDASGKYDDWCWLLVCFYDYICCTTTYCSQLVAFYFYNFFIIRSNTN